MAKKKTSISGLVKKGYAAYTKRESKEDRELKTLRKKLAAKQAKETAAQQKRDKQAEIARLKKKLAEK